MLDKGKVNQLFRFIREFATLRFPIVRDINDSKIRWKLLIEELPECPSIFVYRFSSSDREQGNIEGYHDTGRENQSVLLRVRRPHLEHPPEPPPSIKDWINGSWDNPLKEPEHFSEHELEGQNGETQVEYFESDLNRQHEWTKWLERWRAWAQKERINRKAREIYERFHELYGEIKREGERYKLFLADGIISWRWQDGFVHFPLILLPVQLKFNPDVPEFVVIETEENPELYITPLRESPLVDPEVLSNLRDEISSGRRLVHPLEDMDTTAFLKEVAHALSPDGEFCPEPIEQSKILNTHTLRIWRQPMLLLMPRTQSYIHSIEILLEDLEDRDDLPTSLKLIVGDAPPHTPDPKESALPKDDLELLESVFFTKPWNREQLQIASRLDRFSCVSVQGPPGTGKTHTIANLIGHLLAQGKSILVTAHTSKALRVLRDHIPEPLRPLAVSLLDDDLASRRQLEEAARAITERLSKYDASELHREAKQLEQKRKKLLQKIAHLRSQLVEVIGSEYRSIVVGGQEYHPSEAAKIVAEGEGVNDWIPAPVELGISLPLSLEELVELYRLNDELSKDDEEEMSLKLPELDNLFPPDRFEQMVELLKKTPQGHRPDWWLKLPGVDEVDELLKIKERALVLGQILTRANEWELKIISSSEEREIFEILLFRKAETLKQLVISTMEIRIKCEPKLPEAEDWEEFEKIAKDLAARAEKRGGKLSWRDRLFLPRRYRQFLRSSKVAGIKPSISEHFHSLAAEAEIRKEREQIYRAWNHLIASKGGPDAESLGILPENSVLEWAPKLRRLLSLKQEISVLIDELQRFGFLWNHARKEIRTTNPIEYWRSLGEFLYNSLPSVLDAVIFVAQQREVKQYIKKLQSYLSNFKDVPTVAKLLNALEQVNIQVYRESYERLCSLIDRYGKFLRRKELLEKLNRFAPAWAEAIRNRVGIHGKTEIPGDPFKAWLWRQFKEELDRRASLDPQTIQRQLEECMQELYDVTQMLVENRAWAYRVEKTTLEQRQALIGWSNTIRRLGKGKGKSAQRLRREAAELLSKAKDAVPVWIMPISRVLEQFNPATTRFDVVIVDEASQCDILGLSVLYMGREVVIVGDHEQVSPEGVGMELRSLEQLQLEYLKGIPNAHLYDGRRSLYDIARESFGGILMLTEHFRCVPEIIQFSNRLCYGGRIRPLRESNSTPLKPPVVPYRVYGIAHNHKNKEEAITIASIILAILEHPVYANKTIGVISMVGDEQASYIESLVYRLCMDDPNLVQELERRRFLCGSPAQFQGDERDVVFLSLIDSPKPGGPLPLRSDERFKQRFNVAASRARDQLWVVYSLDPTNDLKEGDLRRDLIMFAKQVYSNPESVLQIPEAEKTQSPFEREVFEYLVQRGYRVYPQWPVGNFRIDLVVEGNGCRVAIECDGDRYHPIEKIPHDLDRQAILERLGWRFIRIRGSEFYRDRISTFQRLERELERLGIRPRDKFSPSELNNINYSLVDEIKRRAEQIKTKLKEQE